VFLAYVSECRARKIRFNVGRICVV
jgi:hypothetical protein